MRKTPSVIPSRKTLSQGNPRSGVDRALPGRFGWPSRSRTTRFGGVSARSHASASIAHRKNATPRALFPCCRQILSAAAPRIARFGSLRAQPTGPAATVTVALRIAPCGTPASTRCPTETPRRDRGGSSRRVRPRSCRPTPPAPPSPAPGVPCSGSRIAG